MTTQHWTQPVEKPAKAGRPSLRPFVIGAALVAAVGAVGFGGFVYGVGQGYTAGVIHAYQTMQNECARYGGTWSDGLSGGNDVCIIGSSGSPLLQ